MNASPISGRLYANGQPWLLNRRTAVLHLVACGLIERRSLVTEDVTVSELPGRNRVFAVALNGRHSYVVKQVGETLPYRLAAIALDYECLRFAATIPEIKRRLPHALRFDPRHGVLVLRFESGTQLNRHLRKRSNGIEECSRILGASLARVHSCFAQPSAALKTRLSTQYPWALRENGLLKTLRFQKSRGQVGLAIELSRHSGIADQITAARSAWQASTTINADLKFANCLWRSRRKQDSAVFLDWELASWGDPAWDGAGILHSFLGQFAIPHPAETTQTLRELSDSASNCWPQLTTATQAFWQGYASGSQTMTQEPVAFGDRALRYAGIRLIQNAVESLKDRPKPTPESLLLVQMGINLLKQPEAYRQLIANHAAV